MCELFAMSSRAPTTVSFSLAEFARHGGGDGPHKDGWGIAYFDAPDVQLFKETDAANDSAFARFIKEHHFVSNQVISHIRLATQGGPTLKNTHPFARELAGRMHVFAHNGDLTGIHDDPIIHPTIHPSIHPSRFHPVGDTDSEYAFCHLLDAIEPLWTEREPPSLAARFEIVSNFAAQIRPFGPANFLYADGDALFVHGHKRTQPGRVGYHPPGLHRLCRTCSLHADHADLSSLRINGLDLGFEDDRQEVTLIASVPLTDEHWIPLAEGELLALRGGAIIKQGLPEYVRG